MSQAEELWIALSRLEWPLPIHGATKSLCSQTPCILFVEQSFCESWEVGNKQEHFVFRLSACVQHAREKLEMFCLQEKWASLSWSNV